MSSLSSDFGHEMHLLQQRVDSLDEEVRQLRQDLTTLSNTGSSSQRRLPPVSQELLQTAERLAIEVGFQVKETELESDPDFDDSPYYVLNVSARGAPKELITLQKRWHERLYLVDKSYIGHIRMCVFPEP